MTDDRFQAALDYIYSFVDYETQRRPHDALNYDLRRVEEILGRLGNPHNKAKSVHVAGSKGKGSVSAMIASVLSTSGYRTGLYTSPHLLNFNERIRVDDRLASDAEIADLVDRIKPEVEAVNSKATYGRLTTFEIITALGFAYFAMKECDINVVEVGLGGRLDATNVILPEVCAITSISLEHTDVLGNTLAEIAAEKAGIIKQGRAVVSSPQATEVDRVIDRVCREKQARLVRAGIDITWEQTGFDASQQSLKVKGRLGEYELTIPLVGEYQLENAAVAVGCLETLMEKGYHTTPSSITAGLAKVNWPGRLQVLRRHPYVVADGAHNPYSAAKLREALQKYFRFEHATLIIGTSSDKDIAGMVAELAPVFSRVIVTRSIHPRALATATLVAEFNRQGIAAEATEDISVALPMAISGAGENDLICVTGSLFVAAGAIDLTNATISRPGDRGGA
jgi:dihydrofolate synthase/folylpolyglutamate synthase